MITNIDIDEDVVAEAMKLSGARTKREVVDRALREMVARARRPSIREMFGSGGIDPDYDHKLARGAGPWVRVEEPRTSYPSTEGSGKRPARAAAVKKPARQKR